MDKIEVKNRVNAEESLLMDQILAVRYEDLETEKRLCKQLLELAEPAQHMYSCAFSNVYLFDSSLALGEFETSDYFLAKAYSMCKAYGYDDLIPMLCNCAGLYFQKLSEENEALKYYLEGIKAADALDDYSMKGKILNNIGLGFGVRGDWETAKEYFQEACSVMGAHMEEDKNGNIVSLLSNLAETSQVLGDLEASRTILEHCESLVESGDQYQHYRLDFAWCSHYAMRGDKDRCIEIVDQIFAQGFLEFDNKFFSQFMLETLLDNMIVVGEPELAMKLIDHFERGGIESPILGQYNIHLLKIKFLEKFGSEEELDLAYRKYYDVMKHMTAIDDNARAKSMNSRIQLIQALAEQEEMYARNKELENMGQIDELTKLYNRRFFNKMLSKVVAREDVRTLGIIMVDVDYFKQYNDIYGHVQGDFVLREVADSLKKWSNENIYVSRYGGDEFICLSINRDDEVVLDYVQHVQNTVKEKHILHEGSKCSDILSLSVGYCNEDYTKGTPPELLVDLADQALYAAKEAGRNQAVKRTG